jgi:autotransporter-associated beta strand protein
MGHMKILRVGSALVAAAIISSTTFAGTTWDGGGGDNNWGTGANWNDNSSPPVGTSVDLTFAGNTRLTPFNNYTAWDDFRAIYFASGAGSFTITGNSIDFFDTSNGGKIENNSSVLQTFSIANFSVSGGTYEFNPVNGSLTLGGGGSIFNNGNNIDVYGNNGHTLTIAKNLQQGGGLTVQQNSIVEFTAASTYTGDTIINAGSVRIGAGGSLGGTIVRVGATSGGNTAGYYISDADGGTTEDTTIVIRNGSSGTKTLGGLNTSGINTFSGTVALDDNVTLSAAAGGTMAFSGAISDGAGAGTFGVAVNAAGTVRLSGSGANSGMTGWTIQEGTLELSKSTGVNAINSGGVTIESGGTMRNLVTHQISDSGNVSIQNGGAWDLNSFSETINSLGLASGSSLSLGTAQLIVENQAAGVWAGTISGSSGGSIVKKGANTISVTGNNAAMASHWFVVGGIVGFNHANAGGSTMIYLGETSGGDAATIDISSAGVNMVTDITVRDGSSGAKTIDNASGGTVTFSGDILLDDNVTFSAGSGENTIFSGTISQDADVSSEKIVKTGSGTVTLSGNNTYSGNTEIDGGTLNVAGDLSGSSFIYLGNGANSDAATLELSGSGSTLGSMQVNVSAGSGARTINVTAGSHTMSGGSMTVDRAVTINASGGSLNIAHTVSLALTETGSDELTINATGGSVTLSGATAISMGSDRDLGVTGSGNTTISGAISASTGAAQINKSGSGTLTISGDNTGSSYMLNIAGGTVALNHANALGNTAFVNSDKVNFNSSGTLQVNANAGTSTLDLRVANGQVGTIEVTGANVFTVDTLRNVSGSGTFTKTGSGTLEIVGASPFSGTLNVNAGTVDVQGSLSSSVNMSGGTLTGDGSVGALVIGSGSVLSPGNSPGTINAGNTTWAGGGSYLWEINDVDAGAGSDPGWDLLNITGTLTISATSGNEFDIDITSLTLANAAGDVHDFNGLNNYSWIIASASGGISGFDASDFTLSLGGFSNPYDTTPGSWFISQSGNNILLNYNYLGGPLGGGGGGESAVPEPNTLLYFGLATAGLLAFRRKALIARAA